MIGQHLNDAAFPDVAARALLDHGLHLLPEAGQPRDPVVDVGEVLSGDGVRLPAGPVGMAGQVEQGADVLDLEAELAGVPDEPQRPDVGLAVGAPVAFRSLRLRQESRSS